MIIASLISTPTHAVEYDTSSVYTCRFKSDMTGQTSIRMKDYFDAAQNMRVGKVDLLQNGVLVASSPIKVYQIPLLDNATVVQIWNASSEERVETVYVNALTSTFEAAYVKNSERQDLLCTLLRN